MTLNEELDQAKDDIEKMKVIVQREMAAKNIEGINEWLRAHLDWCEKHFPTPPNFTVFTINVVLEDGSIGRAALALTDAETKLAEMSKVPVFKEI